LNFNPSKIRANPKVVAFYKSLEIEKMISTISMSELVNPIEEVKHSIEASVEEVKTVVEETKSPVKPRKPRATKPKVQDLLIYS
jgi:hypothetical protein